MDRDPLEDRYRADDTKHADEDDTCTSDFSDDKSSHMSVEGSASGVAAHGAGGRTYQHPVSPPKLDEYQEPAPPPRTAAQLDDSFPLSPSQPWDDRIESARVCHSRRSRVCACCMGARSTLCPLHHTPHPLCMASSRGSEVAGDCHHGDQTSNVGGAHWYRGGGGGALYCGNSVE